MPTMLTLLYTAALIIGGTLAAILALLACGFIIAAVSGFIAGLIDAYRARRHV